MSDLTDPADPAGLAHGLPRPRPPRTWHDRWDDMAAGGQLPGRLVAAVVAVAVAVVVGWRVLAPQAPPPEMEIPLAETVAPTGCGRRASG